VRVAELWRFPVKSLQGERLEAAEITPEGIAGDRGWAIFDGETGLGLTGRREPALLFASARLAGAGVEITLPDGRVAADDAALSTWLGRPVTLRSVTGDGERAYENPADFEREETSPWRRFMGPQTGPFHDSARLSLVSAATLGGWDRRRFRANVVLDGAGEDELVGTRVRLGGAVLDVVDRMSRCVMTTRAQPGGIERDLEVLRTIARDRGARLAVAALVREPGGVRVGDGLEPEG
jgi:hypothetical protein